MGTFDRYSNFVKQANFTGVTFGESRPVLEVELNELQQIQNEARKDFIKDIIDGGFINDPDISYDGVSLQLSEEAIVYLNGSRIIVPTVYTIDIPTTPEQLVFLEAWYEDVSFEDTLTMNGGEGQSTVPNNIKDNRYPVETTRRLVLRWRLRNTSDLTLVATPIKGNLEIPSLINFTKKTDNLYVGEDSGASFDGVVYAIPLVLISENIVTKIYNKIWTDSDHKKNNSSGGIIYFDSVKGIGDVVDDLTTLTGKTFTKTTSSDSLSIIKASFNNKYSLLYNVGMRVKKGGTSSESLAKVFVDDVEIGEIKGSDFTSDDVWIHRNFATQISKGGEIILEVKTSETATAGAIISIENIYIMPMGMATLI